MLEDLGSSHWPAVGEGCCKYLSFPSLLSSSLFFSVSYQEKGRTGKIVTRNGRIIVQALNPNSYSGDRRDREREKKSL